MVLTSIFEGSISVLIWCRTSNFLGYLKSYVSEEDGVLIMKLAGGLWVVVFYLEWVILKRTGGLCQNYALGKKGMGKLHMRI
ncbi:hypothetical protein V6N13_050578 [Hibiscus sabdariffa]